MTPRLCALSLALFFLSACGSLPRFGSQSDEAAPAQIRGRALLLLPDKLADREGWADDLADVFGALHLPASDGNLCAVLAVTEQESGFKVDPPVPDLPRIALAEIESRAASAFVPKSLVHAALELRSPTGATYRQRLDAARTERALSELFEDFISEVPLGRRLLADYNPVRTGGPMQVSIAFAETHAGEQRYPFANDANVRREVFTRRGGLYFGVAHLLAYPARYDSMLYRFADYNAGRYASRNAAFQNAVSLASGTRLALDGDVATQTERAVLSLDTKPGLDQEQVRRDLELSGRDGFDATTTWRKVFELAEARARRPLPRAQVPQIRLQSPKITRKLTTAWFAQRVEERQQRCLARAGLAPPR